MMKTKVIYIIGSAHSGSTLLDLILGSHSRIESVGEINERFSQMLTGDVTMLEARDQICTCGAKLLECPYWVPIVDRVRRQRVREEDFLLNPRFAERDNGILIGEVLRHSSKQAYLESTKSIERLWRLQQDPRFDVYVLHLIRDGRAVVYSNVCKGRDVYTYAARWRDKNLTLLSHRHAFPMRWLTVTYERLVTSPEQEIRRIMRFVEEDFEETQLDYSNARHHNLDGNRLRFRRTSEIVADTRYLSDMRTSHWVTVTASAFRALRNFGYPLSRRRAQALFLS